MSYQSTILADNPIRYYRGSITDIGSQHQNGTVQGSISTGQPGLLPNGDPQTSINFNGTGFVTIPTTGLPSGASPWTMEAWVMWTVAQMAAINFDAWQDIGTAGSGDVVPFVNSTAGGPITAGFNGLTNFSSGQSVVANQVFYVVIAFDGSTGFIDVFSTSGQFSASHAEAANIVYGGASFGAQSNGSIPLQGSGQEFAWYNTALSAARKLAHYTAGTTNPKIVSGAESGRMRGRLYVRV